MNIISHLQDMGFDLRPPVMERGLLEVEMLKDISSRDFGRPYESIQDMIGGNLYKWLHQSYGVLWQMDEADQKAIIYTNTTEKLGERFATLLRMATDEGKAATLQMVSALAVAKYSAEKVVFSMEGNWLLKYRNAQHHGLLKLFVFWLAATELAAHEQALRCLHLFIKKFAKDVDLEFTAHYSREAIMDAFIRCFFLGQNEVDLFILALQKPELPIQALR